METIVLAYLGPLHLLGELMVKTEIVLFHLQQAAYEHAPLRSPSFVMSTTSRQGWRPSSSKWPRPTALADKRQVQGRPFQQVASRQGPPPCVAHSPPTLPLRHCSLVSGGGGGEGLAYALADFARVQRRDTCPLLGALDGGNTAAS
ncbi:hypothetical protein NL676_002030 [Syzygium grande]|nr:hypothetical protein NL676_002030 [Syzygium grande]